MNVQVATIGSAVLDVHVKSKDFNVTPIHDELMMCEVYGGKMNVDDAIVTSGGAGTNTAVSFARQGFSVACVAKIGKDIAAQVVWDDLKRDRVIRSLLVQDEQAKTGISVLLVAGDGARSGITYRGASHALQVADIPFEHLEKLQAIHLSSVGQMDVIQAVMKHCVDHQIFLSWNPSLLEAETFFKQVAATGKCCDILFVNEHEWAAIESVKQKVLASCPIVIVTRGKEGGDVLRGDTTYHYEAKHDLTVINETGAGDAFASGLVGAHLRGSSIEDAVKFGVENASSVVQHMGAKEGLLRSS